VIFCKSIKTRATAKEFFNILWTIETCSGERNKNKKHSVAIDGTFKNCRNIEQSDYAGMCMATTRERRTTGLTATMSTRRYSYVASLATEQLCAGLSEVVDTVIKALNDTKIFPL
jgi:hypothetical protein